MSNIISELEGRLWQDGKRRKLRGQWEGKGALAGRLRKAPDQPGVGIL